MALRLSVSSLATNYEKPLCRVLPARTPHLLELKGSPLQVTPCPSCKRFSIKKRTAISNAYSGPWTSSGKTVHLHPVHRLQLCHSNCTKISKKRLKLPASIASHTPVHVMISSIGAKSSIRLWLQSAAKRSYERGNGSRNIWIGQLLRVRLLRLLPTLRLFSPLWAAYLRRLTEHGEHDLVAWLRTYERPLPFALAQQYASSSPPPTYVSFWTGFEGTVAGSGAGNQPAEALHAPWQRELQALGGKGNISHVLGVMQKLYTQHWEKWYDWHSSDPLRLSASAPRLLSVFLFFCFTILQHSDLRNHVICHILGGIDTINIALLLGHLGSRLLVSFPQLLRAA